MAARTVSIADLARHPGEVARGLAIWQRGDRDEAVRLTLGASAGSTHGRAPTLWVWSGRSSEDAPVWVLPVATPHAQAFAPRGPAGVLVRLIAAAIDAAADPQAVRILDWEGWVTLEVPGVDADLTDLAIVERNPDAGHIHVAVMPADLRVDAPEMELPAVGTDWAVTGLPALASALDVHPVEVALALAAKGLPVEGPDLRPELAGHLRGWGLSGDPAVHAEPPVGAGMQDIDDDPFPRRRHARRVLRRLLRMGKVGAGYHTAFDHLYRGAPADQRRDALEVGEALLRAGLLGEKPSVGQRHVSLRREALPAIHALIERGETDDPALEAFLTAPPP